MILRPEIPSDYPTIRMIHQAAFSGEGEVLVVELLRQAGKATVSLVAIEEGALVGHILFSPVTVEPPSLARGTGLAPLGVLPSFQQRGVGSNLMHAGMEACRSLGFDFVVVLGHPSYYTRFGFIPASAFGLNNEYGVDEPFMARELNPGCLSGVYGLVRYAEEFKQAFPKD